MGHEKRPKVHLFCIEERKNGEVRQALDKQFQLTVLSIDMDKDEYISTHSTPKVIVLKIDGEHRKVALDLCRGIKANEQFELTEIIVLDRDSSNDEKLDIYDAGASDFLVSPFDTEELIKKVSLAIFRHTHFEESALQAKSAMETAMSAIMDAGELGTVIHFMRDSFNCKSVEQLADLVIESSLRFGLSSSVQIATSWAAVNRTSSESISPLEVEMLTALQTAGRIHQKGMRLLLHFGPITQIIKNLPEDDEYKCGRLRDHLALILEGANSRLQALIAIEEMKDLMEETNESFRKVHEQESAQKKENVKIMDEMVGEIQDEFFRHGLTEDQEVILIATIDRYVERIFSAYEAGLKVDEEMAFVADRIKRSLEKVAR
jgi:DNA-binding response OmpR family regulator